MTCENSDLRRTHTEIAKDAKERDDDVMGAQSELDLCDLCDLRVKNSDSGGNSHRDRKERKGMDDDGRGVPNPNWIFVIFATSV